MEALEWTESVDPTILKPPRHLQQWLQVSKMQGRLVTSMALHPLSAAEMFIWSMKTAVALTISCHLVLTEIISIQPAKRTRRVRIIQTQICFRMSVHHSKTAQEWWIMMLVRRLGLSIMDQLRLLCQRVSRMWTMSKCHHLCQVATCLQRKIP